MYNVHQKRRGCVGSNSCRQYSRLKAAPLETQMVYAGGYAPGFSEMGANVADITGLWTHPKDTVARQSSATQVVTAAGDLRTNVPVSYTGDPNVDANNEPVSHVITEKAGKMGVWLLVGAIGLGALWMFSQR